RLSAAFIFFVAGFGVVCFGFGEVDRLGESGSFARTLNAISEVRQKKTIASDFQSCTSCPSAETAFALILATRSPSSSMWQDQTYGLGSSNTRH
ncbi:hypothetical protein BKA62DRAFT_724415, partial [Auriculariales sp. MPI-PUGE-AT-0066]